MPTPHPQPTIHAPLEQKLSWARACHEEIGQQLRDDPRVAELLDQLAGAMVGTSTARDSSGVALRCLRCHQEEGGTCCGSGIDDHFDSMLLLVNLLLGSRLPPRRANPKDCRFLGPDGCTMQTRQVLCLNYLCSGAERSVSASGLASLRDMEGIEIMAQHHLLVRLSTLVAATRFH